jgi:GTP cyclohydrolase IA
MGDPPAPRVSSPPSPSAAIERGAAAVSPPDVLGMERAIRDWLVASGLDAMHADLASTPARVARVWAGEFLDGYSADPAQLLGELVVGEADPDVVVVTGLRFHAMCPHHMFPYRGLAHVAYLPAGKLVGFGRLGKLVECFAHRLTLQERITSQIAEALMQHLGARGAGVVLEAEQLCLALPGDKHDSSTVTTSSFLGEAAERPDIRQRLFAAVQGR